MMLTRPASRDGFEAPPASALHDTHEDDFLGTQPPPSFSFAKAILVLGVVVVLALYLQVYRLQKRLQESQNIKPRVDALSAQLLSASAVLRQELSDDSFVLRYENRSRLAEKSRAVADYVYSNAKEQHYLQKIAVIKEMAKMKAFQGNEAANVSYQLAMNNYKPVHFNIHLKREIDRLLQTEYKRLSKEHDFTLPEQTFCIVVPTLNNGQDFRYEYNLQSIYNQNYTNYKVVVIDDASKDSTYQLTQAFIQENPIPQPVYLIRNKQRISALPNIYRAASEFCAPDDILMLVDGDDELLGVNVLKVFNSMYTRHGLDVLYSNFINHNRHDKKVRLGWSSGYTPLEKKFSIYREESTRMFPIRSFRVSTFLKIPVANLQDDAGEFFKSAYDQTICPQVLELSCGRNAYLNEHHYFRNAALGNNDMEVDPELNFRIVYTVRNKRKRLECKGQ